MMMMMMMSSFGAIWTLLLMYGCSMIGEEIRDQICGEVGQLDFLEACSSIELIVGESKIHNNPICLISPFTYFKGL